MAIDSAIIDTNAYAAFKRGEQRAVSIVNNLKTTIITPIVIGELISGFVLGNREEQNKKELYEFLNSSKVALIEINYSTAEYFAQTFKELKEKGKPIPTNDMWIAATAREYDLSIFTFDNHFRYLENVLVISQLSDL